MFLYNIINRDKLDEIKEIPFKKEIELHKLCESNLENIFGLKLLKENLLLIILD
ncbi:hypothetical protein [Clostridium beijerinckii]|uniref:hypothetical protein n=1 Tax=Clostridium beijerinckii TaxID=1520 RepID=UPI001FABD177|nr:hypothetical protein [Clostridium beijerinckii]